MIGLTRSTARQIIERVGSSGAPPEWGFQFFTAGLDLYLKVLEEECRLKSTLKARNRNGPPQEIRRISAKGGFTYGKNLQTSGSEDIMVIPWWK